MSSCPLLRLNIPLNVTNVHQTLAACSASQWAFQYLKVKSYVASRTPPLFTLGISHSQVYITTPVPQVIEPHVTWSAGLGRTVEHGGGTFFVSADPTPRAIATSWAPRTLVELIVDTSCRPSVSSRPFFQASG
jgi:hypothetical protein